MPHIFIIGGPNGAGKSTAARTLLPELLECDEYVNADEIAKALSPFHPETTAFQAGRLMLERCHFLAENKKTFAFESTLASLSFASFLKKHQKNYTINILFLWLPTPEMAIERVKKRVISGGHDIPEATIRRRYERSIRNFLQLYMPLAHEWILCDNSSENPRIISEKRFNQRAQILNEKIWDKVRSFL